MQTSALNEQLAELFWSLPAHFEPEAIAARVAETLARTLEAPLVALWRFEGDAPACLGAAGLSPKKCTAFAQTLGVSRSADAPARKSDLSFGKRKLGAAVVVPFPGGALGLARYAPAQFSDLEVEMTALLLARVGPSLEAARVHRALELERRDLRLLVELGRIASAPGEPGAMVGAFSEHLAVALGLSMVAIALVERDALGEARLPLEATYTADPAKARAIEAVFAERPLSPEEYLTEAVIASNRLTIVDRVEDTPLLRPETRAALGDGSLAAVPLTARGRFVGVMFWHRAARSGPFPPRERAFMSQLGAWLGLAIDHARLTAPKSAQA